MGPLLYRVALRVDDLARADRFWSELLQLPVDPVVPTRHDLHTAGAILALVDPSQHGAAFRPAPEWIYVRVPDLDAAWERAQAFGCGPAPGEDAGIRDRPWGERSFYGLDPAGNPICLVDRRTRFLGTGGSA